jgi:hypothetical protein
MGREVAQWVEALRYKPGGRRFDSRYSFFGRTMALGLTQPLTEMSKYLECFQGGG